MAINPTFVIAVRVTAHAAVFALMAGWAVPHAGQQGMTIGLSVFRDCGELRLDRLLTQPFRDDQSATSRARPAAGTDESNSLVEKIR